MSKITEEDLLNIQQVGRVGKYIYPFNHLWFALKDKILEKYGLFQGYDLQSWDDLPNDDAFGDFEGATHNHILKTYWLSAGNIDNGAEFIDVHSPTNEYEYVPWGYGYYLKSDGYDEFELKCKHTFKGKKKYSSNREDQEIAWKALKRLVGKFGDLLKCYKQKELPFPEEEQSIPF